jgi:hypothetical protein
MSRPILPLPPSVCMACSGTALLCFTYQYIYIYIYIYIYEYIYVKNHLFFSFILNFSFRALLGSIICFVGRSLRSTSAPGLSRTALHLVVICVENQVSHTVVVPSAD